MPRYRVKNRGFYEGQIYDPEGKRKFVNTEKPINPCPLWLEPVKSETAAEKKKRETSEKRKQKQDISKSDRDKEDISNLSFMGAGESAVETL
jgi:hypothetical protein